MKRQTPKPRRLTVDEEIAQGAERASAAYEKLKAEFAKDFAQNPTFAIQWLAEAIVKAQTCELWWRRLAAVAIEQDAQTAIERGKNWAQGQIDHFFRSNTTCPWHNGCRRAEAETYNDLLRQDVARLEKSLQREGGPADCTPTN